MVNATVAKKIDKKANIVWTEIDMATFAQIDSAGIHYVEPSKFPEIEIDLSFLSATYAPIAQAIEKANCALIKDVRVVDTYTDDSGKSITVRLRFSHAERTLTKEEVLTVVNGIVDQLSAQDVKMKGEVTL